MDESVNIELLHEREEAGRKEGQNVARSFFLGLVLYDPFA